MKTFQECTKFQVSSMVREKDPSQAFTSGGEPAIALPAASGNTTLVAPTEAPHCHRKSGRKAFHSRDLMLRRPTSGV